ncbi:hypothetical protein FPJ27_14525 [Burkholderia sp. MS455]|uniref:hypothetical protein n=1 Tax=Burkholderia sp. MS455 TaxID=2811788 RepID=UPI00195C8E5D|nr:hypothetical protein [Burkholderia sp. MS455]QRR07524.1 hypothetical protein FPJ27_14525 [Burkholderia sp. MS455]
MSKQTRPRVVTAQTIMDALNDKPGSEAFRLAAMLGISTVQANEWLATLVMQGRVDKRHRQADASGRIRTRYYARAERIRPLDLRVTACAPSMLAAMVRGKPYGMKDLIDLTGFTKGRGEAVISNLVANGYLKAVPKKNQPMPRFTYYLADPKSESAPSSEGLTKLQVIGGPEFDSEYSRMLLKHRDLCNAYRYRG